MASLSSEMVVQASAHLAAAGKYAEASLFLDTLTDGQITIAARLLRAKILAQQGRFAEAITHWRGVLDAEPDQVEAKRGIALAQRMDGGTSGWFLLRRNLYSTGLLAAVTCLLLGISFAWGRHWGVAALEPTLVEQQNRIKLDTAALDVAKAMAAHPDDRRLQAIETRIVSAEKNLVVFQAAVEKRFTVLDAGTAQSLKSTLAGNSAMSDRLGRVNESLAALQTNSQGLQEAQQETGKRLAKIEREAESRQKALDATLSQAVQSLAQQAKTIAGCAAALRAAGDTLLKTGDQNASILRKELQTLRNEVVPWLWLSESAAH